MSKRTPPIAILLGLSMLVFSGCSEVPQERIDNANSAFAAAQGAEAETYASTTWLEAVEAMNQAKAELEAQSEQTGIFRSYGDASDLLATAQTQAEKAREEAVATKELVRQETAAVLEATRTDVQLTTELLAAAPRGKDTRAEIESMQLELQGLTTLLDEAAAAAQAERYQAARAQIDQVNAEVSAIRADLEAALAKVKSNS